MVENQEGVDANYVLHVADTGDNFACSDSALPASSAYACSGRTHTRPADSQGEWWSLADRLAPTSSSGPAQRSYHAAASIASDGKGNSSCVYIYSGRDYANSLNYDDLWRLCPVLGYLGTSADTTFAWTELVAYGNLPKSRCVWWVLVRHGSDCGIRIGKTCSTSEVEGGGIRGGKGGGYDAVCFVFIISLLYEYLPNILVSVAYLKISQ